MAKSLEWALGVGEGKLICRPAQRWRKKKRLAHNKCVRLSYSILVNLGFPVVLKISYIAETTQSYFSQPTSKMVGEAS